MNKLFFLGFSVLILLASTGCTFLTNGFSNSAAAPVTLEIQQVSATGQPGRYATVGTTTLPDQTRLSVSAVRLLDRGDNQTDSELASAAYAILDREFVKVENGQWQSELSLWEVSPDGHYRETWQVDPELETALTPLPTVAFLAAVEPEAIDQRVERQLAQPSNENNPLFSFTDNGNLYLQAVKEMPIDLPDRTLTASVPTTPESPWQDRSKGNTASELQSVPELPYKEVDNLPLPKQNQLQ